MCLAASTKNPPGNDYDNATRLGSVCPLGGLPRRHAVFLSTGKKKMDDDRPFAYSMQALSCPPKHRMIQAPPPMFGWLKRAAVVQVWAVAN